MSGKQYRSEVKISEILIVERTKYFDQAIGWNHLVLILVHFFEHCVYGIGM